LLRAGRWLDLPAGSTLTREGTPVECVYLLVRGTADVETCGRVVALLQAGSFAGEMSFLSGLSASATVTTVSDSRVFAISQHELRRLMSKNRHMRAVLQERFCGDLVAKLRMATQAA
jgi:CRP-like cAMP-binding protein